MEELRAVRHFVRSPRRLMSELRLAATQPHAAQNRTGPTLSTRVTRGLSTATPQWGAEDAEIKVLSDENTELKVSPFEPWSKSVYSHTCYAYCQGFLPC